MRRVFIAALFAGLSVGLPYVLDRWNPFESALSATGICTCAPMLPGVYAVLPVFDTFGVDFFDSSCDLEVTGTVLMVGISFIAWFITSLLAADVVSMLRRIRGRVVRRAA